MTCQRESVSRLPARMELGTTVLKPAANSISDAGKLFCLIALRTQLRMWWHASSRETNITVVLPDSSPAFAKLAAKASAHGLHKSYRSIRNSLFGDLPSNFQIDPFNGSGNNATAIFNALSEHHPPK